jgi:two-component system cell cycle sensor histidine kinase/response regulator CckA
MKGGVGRKKNGTADQETILLVDDESAIRSVAKMFLEMNGYHVIEAESGPEALTIWEGKQSRIDLMVTDLVLPDGFTGQQLAQRLQVDCPDLRVIFSSGYDPQVFTDRDLLKAEINFLQKPYRLSSLTQMVRQSLDAEQAA